MTQDVRDLIADAREAAVRSALWDIPHLLFRLVDALEASLEERDAAVAAIERLTTERHRLSSAVDGVRKLHVGVVGERSDSVCAECTRINRYGQVAYPCPTIAALDGAPEPEVNELPETGNELRDEDGDLISSGKHLRILQHGMYVCDTCTNVLGLNVRWDRAGFMEGHPLPVEGEKP